MQTRLAEVLEKHHAAVLSEWIAEQKPVARAKRIADAELERECAGFLDALRAALAARSADADGAPFAHVRELLVDISHARARLGFTASETATFVFSLKKALFSRIGQELDSKALPDELWSATILLDRLGLLATEEYQRSREEIIGRQHEEMLELSTPVIKLWDGILALPLIGTLDSSRTQVVMETLLSRIVETESAVAILDITGVPTVDTLVAQHLLKTVAAARLMGADCIISGIRPQIAQTLVHLGVELGTVTTKATLADAFALALRRTGHGVLKIPRKGQRTDGSKEQDEEQAPE